VSFRPTEAAEGAEESLIFDIWFTILRDPSTRPASQMLATGLGRDDNYCFILAENVGKRKSGHLAPDVRPSKLRLLSMLGLVVRFGMVRPVSSSLDDDDALPACNMRFGLAVWTDPNRNTATA
jgi:hypothetical protein